MDRCMGCGWWDEREERVRTGMTQSDKRRVYNTWFVNLTHLCEKLEAAVLPRPLPTWSKTTT
jgi:hypothetical protein